MTTSREDGRASSEMNQDERGPAFIVLSPDDIAACAYKRYVDRGAIHGFDRDDWLSAEQELRVAGRLRTRGNPR